MKQIIVAKLTHEGTQFVGKRESKMYDENTKIDATVLAHANQGLTLAIQRSIREALKVKNGIKTVSSGGQAVDLSGIDAV